MEIIKDIAENVWVQRGFWSLVVILFSLFIYRVIAKVLKKKEQKSSKILSSKKNKTFMRMLKSIVGYALIIVTTLMVLQIYGIDVSSMLAGVGIASIVIGFALQDSLKDIIRGFTIVSDDYYEVGDVIKFGDNVGPVISVGLLTTKMQDINTMNIVSIANRNIDMVETDSGYIYIPLPLPHELSVEKAEAVIREATKKLGRHRTIDSVAYQGVNQLDPSSINYQIVVTCDPTIKPQTRRDALRIIMTTLEEHKISIPHNQIDLHAEK